MNRCANKLATDRKTKKQVEKKKKNNNNKQTDKHPKQQTFTIFNKINNRTVKKNTV